MQKKPDRAPPRGGVVASGAGQSRGRPASHRAVRDPLIDRAERAAALLRAMAHPQRLRVLCLLAEGERSVGDLNTEVPLSQSALSQHLARLRALRLVATRKESQTVFYRLDRPEVRDLIAVLRESA